MFTSFFLCKPESRRAELPLEKTFPITGVLPCDPVSPIAGGAPASPPGLGEDDIATAKANPLFNVCCRTSQFSLFGSIPVCTETLSLRADNVKNILARFAMKIYLHLLSGSCPSFLTLWLLGDSSVLLSGTVCQFCANNLGWQLWRSKFTPHFCYILPVI